MRIAEVVARFLRRDAGVASHKRLWTDGWRLFSYGHLVVWWSNLERTKITMRRSNTEAAATERHRALLIRMNDGEFPVEIVRAAY